MLPNPTWLSDTMDWQLVAPDFAWDGSWRDIYILDTTTADWQVVWDVLRHWEPPAVFVVEGTIEPMPERVDTAFAMRNERTPLLAFQVGQIGLNCHFFGTDEIEFDLDPREVKGPADAEALAAFMRRLSNATGKTVVLTAENSKEMVIARCLPATGEIVWTALQEH